MITKVISGGQTGVDQAGLQAAKKLGIATGGTAPRDYRTESGPAPWLRDFGLVASEHSSYAVRTRMNIMNSDGTLIIGHSSSGSRNTFELAIKMAKPLVWVVPADLDQDKIQIELVKWVEDYKIHTLNVAGNRESVWPGAQALCEEFLARFLSHYAVGVE